MKKKIRKFQDGGISDENFTPEQLKFLGGADRTDPYILARMRKAAPDAPKATKVDTKVDSGELLDETGEKSKIRRNTETGDLYDTESSFKQIIKNSPVTEEKKPVAVKKEKKEVVVEKEEPKKAVVSDVTNQKKKSSDAEPSFFRGTKGYNLSDVTGKIKSMLPEGSDRRTEKQKAAGEEPSFLRGTKGYSLSDFTKGGSKKDPAYSDAGYKKGGKVSSASKRADGIAQRGKTRA
jgi:hypothetical protein